MGPEEAPQTAPVAGDAEEDLLAECLSWTPEERLRFMLDMLDFEERAHRARLLPRTD